MERQVILLEDLIDVFRQELGHVFEAVDPPGPGRPPVYPAKGLFLGWLFLYLGVADSQRRLVQILAQHPAWRDRLGFGERVPDQSTFSWFKNHRARHVFQRVFDEAVQRLVAAGVIQGDHLVVDASLFHAYSNPRKRDELGAPSDPEASWGFESSTGQLGRWLQAPPGRLRGRGAPHRCGGDHGEARGQPPLFPAACEGRSIPYPHARRGGGRQLPRGCEPLGGARAGRVHRDSASRPAA
jgi:hypothetical protein